MLGVGVGRESRLMAAAARHPPALAHQPGEDRMAARAKAAAAAAAVSIGEGDGREGEVVRGRCRRDSSCDAKGGGGDDGDGG